MDDTGKILAVVDSLPDPPGMRPPSAAAALTAMTALAASCPYPVPQFQSTEKHAPIRGRIVGRSPDMKKQPRNKPCGCGSGMKAKKCHGDYYTPPAEDSEAGSG